MAIRKQVNRHHGRSKKGNGNNVQRNKNTFKQNLDKYLNLAKDSLAAGDRISAENYRQHAEHYQRQLNDILRSESGLRKPCPDVPTPKPSSSEKIISDPKESPLTTVDLELSPSKGTILSAESKPDSTEREAKKTNRAPNPKTTKPKKTSIGRPQKKTQPSKEKTSDNSKLELPLPGDS